MDWLVVIPAIIFLLFFIGIFSTITIGFRRKNAKPVSAQAFAKNPIGNAFNVAFTSIRVLSALDSVTNNVVSNPCQQTAEAWLTQLNDVPEVVRFGIANGNGQGVNYPLWRNTFNEFVHPNKNIQIETKKAIRTALISLSVDHLKNVVDTDAIGRGAEDNVWFTLSLLAAKGKYNVFYSVRLPYRSLQQQSSEIDHIIVCPKGVFLLEVKNTPQSDHPIEFANIKNPYQQIDTHADAFKQNFDNVPYKNLFVMSCSKGGRAFVDLSTFPTNSIYTPLTVETLLEYVLTFDGPDVLDDPTIKAISEKLTSCINYNDGQPITKWIIDGKAGQPSATATPTSSTASTAKFCSHCGSKLSPGAAFCSGCGNKI